VAAFTTELVLEGIFGPTARAGFFEFCPTFTTELLGARIFRLTFRALHLTPPGEVKGKDYLWKRGRICFNKEGN
jgi:hypothetical protein